jgi:hypothetical protein
MLRNEKTLNTPPYPLTQVMRILLKPPAPSQNQGR